MEKETNIYRDIINKIGLCNNIKNTHPTEYKILVDLLDYHPDKKATGLINLKIIKSIYGNNQLIVIFQDREDSISWKDCIKLKMNRKKAADDPLNKAMRNSISDQTTDFKITFKYEFVCEICNISGNDSNLFHTDHVIKYRHIKESFMNDNTLKVPTEFNWTLGTPNFKKEDSEYEEEWKKYHKNMATYRILCRTCNIKEH